MGESRWDQGHLSRADIRITANIPPLEDIYTKGAYLHPMDASELLESLRREARQIARSRPDTSKQKNEVSSSIANSPSQMISQYNSAVFEELIAAGPLAPGRQIDDSRLADFRASIDRYLDDYAPDNPDFKAYIRIVSTYLAFVVRRPLHPPGMVVSGGRAIEFRDGHWRCPAKNAEVRKPGSICKYCVCLGN